MISSDEMRAASEAFDEHDIGCGQNHWWEFHRAMWRDALEAAYAERDTKLRKAVESSLALIEQADPRDRAQLWASLGRDLTRLITDDPEAGADMDTRLPPGEYGLHVTDVQMTRGWDNRTEVTARFLVDDDADGITNEALAKAANSRMRELLPPRKTDDSYTHEF